MPPPKAKMYPKTGKHKTINTSAGPGPSTTSPSASTSAAAAAPATNAADAERQLELELCWCIQTMEASIESGRLNAKQVEDTMKTIKILKSGTQPVIKKRQVMRASFGDYRAKMAEEERKLRLNAPKIQFTTTGSDPNTVVRSHFVKKSAIQTMGKAFKFEFPVVDQLTQLDLNNETDGASTSNGDGNHSGTEAASKPVAIATNANETAFRQSDNTFKFNFNVDMQE